MRLLHKGIWVGLGQIIAAIGQLVGIRLITEFFSPEIFGESILLIGVVSLITTTFFNPLMQALLRFYPEAIKSKSLNAFRGEINSFHKRKLFLAFLLAVFLGAVYVLLLNGHVISVLTLMGLVFIDSIRMKEFAYYNAAQNHKSYSIWVLSEAWLRPLLAILMYFIFGEKIESMLAGYLAGSIIIAVIMIRALNKTGTEKNSGGYISVDIKTYIRPLAPLGIVGWINGIADRYIIGWLLSMAHVGIYSAVYGLTAKPMLMMSNVIETIIRPMYYESIANDRKNNQRKYLIVWMGLTSTISISILLFIILWHEEIVSLLLAEQYRNGSYLMPWIAAGYVLLSHSHIFARVCYAKNNTKWVLYIESISAVAGIGVSIPFIYFWGIMGAAIAVPIYMGIQLLYSVYGAYK